MLLKKKQVFIAYFNIQNYATQRTDTLIGRKKHYILHTVCGIFSVIFHFNHLPTTKALGSRINSIELGHKNINTLVWASWTAVHKKIWTDSRWSVRSFSKLFYVQSRSFLNILYLESPRISNKIILVLSAFQLVKSWNGIASLLVFIRWRQEIQ